MFKLVIVEDEDNIRKSLAELIPWKAMGFTLVGTFADGMDALSYIKNNPCDAVLTDVFMSRMSGLEMTAQLRQLYPEIKVVILSGYSEFAYAQQAIRYKVEHYLVKPVDEDELIAVFKGIRQQLTFEKKHTSTAQALSESPCEEQNSADLLVANYCKLLILEMNLGCKESVFHLLDDFLYRMKELPLQEAKSVVQKLISAIAVNYQKRKIFVRDITAGRFGSEQLYDAASAEIFAQELKETFGILCDALRRRRQLSEHTIITQIIQFLDENIDKDIPHDVIAARYRIHPGYLSRLFKQDMGETLSEYVLRIKIEKAAVLLKEGQYKVGEIAGMLGYSAASYFSIAFKKYTGCSPREYSQRVLL